MPRKKRSEKVVATAAVRPAPAPAALPVVAQRVVAAFCPLCGRTIPKDRAIKIGYVTVDRVPYFGSIDWDENKPFGIVFKASAFEEWEYIWPEEAPELFEALKARFLDALREWVAKGWIKEEEILP